MEAIGKVQGLSIDVWEIIASIQTCPMLGTPLAVVGGGGTKNRVPLTACPTSPPSKRVGGVPGTGLQGGPFQFSLGPASHPFASHRCPPILNHQTNSRQSSPFNTPYHPHPFTPLCTTDG